MAEPAAVQKTVKCTQCDISLPAKPRYAWQDDATHWAVATAMRLVFEDCPPGAKTVHLPPMFLPFGLLESITVDALDTAAAASTRVTISIHRLFGRRESESRPLGIPIALCGHELNIDNESAHKHIKTVTELTRHDFRFRMVAACSVMNIAVQFEGAVPPAFAVTLTGANVLPASVNYATANALIAARGRVPFVFPPIPPRVRQQGAQAAMDSAVEAAAAESAAAAPSPAQPAPKSKAGKRKTKK